MQPKKGHMQAKIKKTHKKASKSLTYTVEENWLDRKEQLTKRITLAVFDRQTDEHKMRTPREKSKNSRIVISRKMMCFKIMKLINKMINYYNFFIRLFVKY